MKYSPEPIDKRSYTTEFNQAYSRFARLYDLAVKVIPLWKRWIGQARPYIRGPRVLEVSFGPGYLLRQYADQYAIYGIDLNEKMIHITRRNLASAGKKASLQQADVAGLPYASETFDTVVNTMAFTGYPDGEKAMGEMQRVLKSGGRLVMVDINYPADGNWLGVKLTTLWASLGDIIRDMEPLFRQYGFVYTDKGIGGFGSIHLYVAEKQ